uniref:SAM domain-containing protein n=1 Tax=Alexandrium catenella TaxID=2925 RepID=A0A7S1S4Y7_ALECA|mmetsp:Transcript_8644/g.23436  ORF Transcript_8644/g.23436 Transcript_8644/m.23436 type:complete len:750 (+) Transcript_8644:61-2310(+)
MSFRPQTSPPPAPPPAPPGAAVQRTEQGSDVVTFLDRAGLGVYSPVFFSHGFTTIECLYSIRPEDYQVMQVKAGHQKKLKLALDNLRSMGQVGAPGTPAGGMMGGTSPEQMAASSLPPYSPHMPPGPAEAGGLGVGAAYGQQSYQKGTIWVDTNNESGYQWVDGPQTPAATPVDQNAVTARAQQQHAQQAQLQAQQQAQAQQPGGLPMYQYSQAGTQWVDTPSAAPQQPVQQDMVFQWVDSPSYGRSQAHQQHYLQPPASPYFQGMDSPSYGMPPRSPLDPAALGYPGSGLGLDQVQYSQRRDLQAAQFAQARQHQALGVEDLTGLRMGQPVADRLPYGAQEAVPPYLGMQDPTAYQQAWASHGQAANAGSYQLFDHPANRRGPQGARPPGPSRGARGQQPGGDGDGPRGRARQAAGGNRQAVEGGTGGGGGNVGSGAGGVGGARRNEQAGDPQVAAVLESMGTEGLRSTLTTTLESLYEDRIKPMANYVKGRLKERSVPELIVKSFVELYAQHPDLYLVQQPSQTQSGDEATIFFVTEPSWFKGWVDIDAPDDPYDECMWEELAKFLDGEHTFAGGRYGMARELMQRNLPFLAPHSLGEVCHIVQLAIQVRRLIVYHRKMLKPIQTVLCQLSPANGNGATAEGEEIKDMDDLCLVLFRMLIHHPQGIRLCRMKQMIKHEFCRKLSEMAFQCTKLIELFNQEPLAQTFVLDTENDGKSIYVRLGNPDTFSEHVKRIYAVATNTEAKQVP